VDLPASLRLPDEPTSVAELFAQVQEPEFVGSWAINGRNGVTWIEKIGRVENDRMIQTRVGDLLVCLRSYGPVTFEERGTGIAAIGPDGRVVIAARDLTTGRTQEVVITTGADGFQYAWSVDGEARAFEPDAGEWRDAMIEALGAVWQSSGPRGQRGS
jgi:hypothetical protein